MEQRPAHDSLVVKMKQEIKKKALEESMAFVFFSFEEELFGNYEETSLFKVYEEKHPEKVSESGVLELGFNILFLLNKWKEDSDDDSGESKEIK